MTPTPLSHSTVLSFLQDYKTVGKDIEYDLMALLIRCKEYSRNSVTHFLIVPTKSQAKDTLVFGFINRGNEQVKRNCEFFPNVGKFLNQIISFDGC